MDIQNMLNQFLGSGNAASSAGNSAQGIGNTLGKVAGNIPGGLVGGAAAGGIAALLVGNKKARKFAGKAATYGGAAVLGGLAYRALQSWQQNKAAPGTSDQSEVASLEPPARHSSQFELAAIKAMIAAAKADGHINDIEQQRIFNAIEQMDLSVEMKALVFDLLRQPISVEEIAQGIDSLEEKSELYLASCLIIDPDHPLELAHLEQLAKALDLPPGLPQQLQLQAQQAVHQAA